MAKPNATCLLLTVFLSLCGLVLVFAGKPNSTPVNDPSLIHRINSMKLGWRAKAQKVFQGNTLGELKRLFPMDSSFIAHFKDVLDGIQQRAKEKEQSNSGVKGDSTVSNSNTGQTKAKQTKAGKKNVAKQSKMIKSNVKSRASYKKLIVKTKTTQKAKPTRKIKRNSGGVATLAKKKSSGGSSTGPIPSSFDARDRYPYCMPQIRQQFQCGSCYAFAATGALSHRFCVATRGKVYPDLAPDYIVRCNSGTRACNGGQTLATWEFLESTGVPTSECVMYRSGYWMVRNCPDICDDGATPLKMYKSKPGTLKKLESDNEIKRSIMNEGSVHTYMVLLRDFMNYEGGVYKMVADTVVGAHAVQLIGWGQEDGDDYWLGVNSWGETWGLNGYFKIKVGELGIGRQTYAALPHLSTN